MREPDDEGDPPTADLTEPSPRGKNQIPEWIAKIREPFFRSPEAAQAYVSSELELATPEGWGIRQSTDEPLTWVIKNEKPRPEEWPNQEYCVRVSSGLDLIIFIYGNNDAGPFSLHHALESALVIETVMLRRFKLDDCLRYVFAHHKPNEWGYT